MGILTKQLIQAFDNIAISTGTLHESIVSSPIIAWHCGTLSSLANVRSGEGIWVFDDESKKNNYVGYAKDAYKINLANGVVSTPYRLELFIHEGSKRIVDFKGDGFTNILGPILKHHEHQKAKIALTEWAVHRGYDLIRGTNGSKIELFIVDANKNTLLLTIEDLLTNTLTRIAYPPSSYGI